MNIMGFFSKIEASSHHSSMKAFDDIWFLAIKNLFDIFSFFSQGYQNIDHVSN